MAHIYKSGHVGNRQAAMTCNICWCHCCTEKRTHKPREWLLRY